MLLRRGIVLHVGDLKAGFLAASARRRWIRDIAGETAVWIMIEDGELDAVVVFR
jgi:hypothetical protein